MSSTESSVEARGQLCEPAATKDFSHLPMAATHTYATASFNGRAGRRQEEVNAPIQVVRHKPREMDGVGGETGAPAAKWTVGEEKWTVRVVERVVTATKRTAHKAGRTVQAETRTVLENRRASPDEVRTPPVTTRTVRLSLATVHFASPTVSSPRQAVRICR